MKEIWIDIEGYEGLYKVSNFGNVKSLSRTIRAGRGLSERVVGERILKPGKTSAGYENVVLSKSKIKKNFAVHRLVAMSFLPTVEGKNEVNHIDGNKTNNNINNLEWVTSSENQIHVYENRLQEAPKKKVSKFDMDGNFINNYESLTKASESTGIAINLISANLRGRSKSSGGYVWKYGNQKGGLNA